MGKKSKKEAVAEESVQDESQIENEATESNKLTYEEQVELTLPIAKPMADRKLAKKLFKVAKKGASKKNVIIGLKMVAKAIKKGEKGLVLLAGDTDPMDVISHFPVLCEEYKLPYMWVPSRHGLGKSISKGSAIVVSVKPSSEYQELYDEISQKIKDTPRPI